jgi:hypothetical protein
MINTKKKKNKYKKKKKEIKGLYAGLLKGENHVLYLSFLGFLSSDG